MILPGIQALFGFQLIAVFNPVFTSLSEPLKDLHFAALLLTILAAALLITPAAYDRQRNTACVSCEFIALVTRLIALALIPLLLSLSFDTFIIGTMVLHNFYLAGVVATGCATTMIMLWFVMPRIVKV